MHNLKEKYFKILNKELSLDYKPSDDFYWDKKLLYNIEPV